MSKKKKQPGEKSGKGLRKKKGRQILLQVLYMPGEARKKSE
jgi:hypothetical protein